MSEEPRKKNVAAELALVRETLEAARRNAAAADFKTAINRLYYAAYHAAIAVLLSEDLEPKTHRGVTHLLKLHFVVPGHLPDEVVGAFSALQTERDLADYEPTYSITAQRYEQRRAEGEKLVTDLEVFLRARGFSRASS